jgi:hypothetical protein
LAFRLHLVIVQIGKYYYWVTGWDFEGSFRFSTGHNGHLPIIACLSGKIGH